MLCGVDIKHSVGGKVLLMLENTGTWFIMVLGIQRPAKKYTNLAKQDPGRARQKSQIRAGRNFSQPRGVLSF